jgi:hypothetical protein
VGRCRLGEVKRASSQREIEPGWNDVDVIALHDHAVGGRQHWHSGVFGEQFAHQAFMRRIEVLNENIGHAHIVRQGGDEPGQCLKPASGRTDADYWKTGAWPWRPPRQ